MKEYEYFKTEFIEKYNENEYLIIEKIINSACECDYVHKNYIEFLGDWECTLDIEKLNSLNFNYFIYLYNTKTEGEINLTFGFGVDAPNDCIYYSFDGTSEKYIDKEVRILKDINLDEEKVKNHYLLKNNILKNVPNEFVIDNLLRKARLIFEREKSKILDLYSKQDYDNYVTGGGTFKTNEFYNKEFKKYEDAGLFWDEVYEYEIVDRNLY
jgi:hypothetical protein